MSLCSQSKTKSFKQGDVHIRLMRDNYAQIYSNKQNNNQDNIGLTACLFNSLNSILLHLFHICSTPQHPLLTYMSCLYICTSPASIFPLSYFLYTTHFKAVNGIISVNTTIKDDGILQFYIPVCGGVLLMSMHTLRHRFTSTLMYGLPKE